MKRLDLESVIKTLPAYRQPSICELPEPEEGPIESIDYYWKSADNSINFLVNLELSSGVASFYGKNFTIGDEIKGNFSNENDLIYLIDFLF
jgi:hypothetical protein